VTTSPEVFAYRSSLATAYFNLGHALRDAGRREEGRRAFTEAIRLVNQFHAEGRRDGRSAHQLFYSHYFRALILGEGGRHRQALADWDRVVALAPGPLSGRARLRRAEARARAGEHGPAAGEAGALAAAKGLRAADRYDLARVFALCAAAARGDDARPLPVGERLAEEHARRAVGLLKEAAAAGHFRDRRNRADLERNADLDALRGRADFRALLAE
jgi:tetratricopeptide (TPR) repeat protein